jgi:ABC transporter with metal-binding/Fe-S-binding domain ATP-binding protein
MGIPLIRAATHGEKEKELHDLKKAIKEATEKYKIEGIVTGAVKSTYQASRVQKICHELGLWCFNPLWLKNQVELLYEIIEREIKAVISGVFAEPLDKSYLGAEIDKTMVEKLAKIESTHHINPAGEGGEIETTVLDAPVFRKKIIITKSESKWNDNYNGTFEIHDARVEQK